MVLRLDVPELRPRQREKDLAVGGEDSAQSPDLVAQLDELRELGFRLGEIASHRSRAEFLEHDLDILEGLEVAVQHPLEQVREELEPVEPPGLARSARALTEVVEHCDRSSCNVTTQLGRRDSPP